MLRYPHRVPLNNMNICALVIIKIAFPELLGVICAYSSSCSTVPPPSPPRVICLCAQFEAVLQHGLKKSRGLALTAAALKQAAGLSSKNEGGTDAALRPLLLAAAQVLLQRSHRGGTLAFIQVHRLSAQEAPPWPCMLNDLNLKGSILGRVC